ncbi:ribokinase [Chryseomicrobium aureum]|uniref:ribokinase n=1 Tax=Chryseomicrobium aureum TaxID=1441723 RepID=UPI00195EFE2D|nr:ribokinase [Chryseomicrobium aureum]MBM7706006.1 ribokinase [Chryseomicrobium aureum]
MITVIGSINMDLVVRTDNFPKQGETRLGDLFATIPGGKGANQAVAAARLGADVTMLGVVGNDAFGRELTENLQNEGIHTASIKRVDKPTGIANILVSDQDNRIIVVPGANHEWEQEMVLEMERIIPQSKVVVFQLEIPVGMVEKGLAICKEHNVQAILNPAPTDDFHEGLLQYGALLTPNESEAETIWGAEWKKAIQSFQNQVIVTLGKDGAMYPGESDAVYVTGYPVEVVDTTGAGDTFNGALAYGLSQNWELAKSIEFANAAASLSVEALGAQTGMPKRAAVDERMTR